MEHSPDPKPTVDEAAEPAVARPARLPLDELASLASDFGIDPTRHRTREGLLYALADRRQLIEELDRVAMLEVVRWGRRPVPADADKERLAQEIARVQRWKYAELSRDGLYVLARLRGVRCGKDLTPRQLIRKIKGREGIVANLNRKRRAWVAATAAKFIGDETPSSDDNTDAYAFLPSESDKKADASTSPMSPIKQAETLRERIEARGLFGGLADRVRSSADTYVNQKLDEIEARIDRKLEEIDNRLGEWRDKELANRLRILKITLWASVIVSIVSLAYAYLTRTFL